VDLNPVHWLVWVPLKIRCFIWKMRLNRIPSKIALGVGGVNVTSEESTDHLLLKNFSSTCLLLRNLRTILINVYFVKPRSDRSDQ